MKEYRALIDTIVKKIETEYKGDVALLVRYNASVTPSMATKTGLDFYFIPKTDRAKRLSTQFIIGGVSFDLFSMSWERLISNAALDSPQAYLLTETEILYAGSDEDLDRFNALKDSIEMVTGPKYLEAMVNKAYEYLNETYIYLHNMTLAGDRLLDIRLESSKIIEKICHALAYANQTYYKGGQGTDLSVIEASYQLAKLPVGYEALVRQIISAKEAELIKEDAIQLVNVTRGFLDGLRDAFAQPEPFETLFHGYYEEFKSILNRFDVACKAKLQSKLFLLAAYMHEEISQFMTKVEEGVWYNNRNYYSEYSSAFDAYFGIDLMDLIANEAYDALEISIRTFENKLLTLMKAHEIDVLEFENTASFISFFEVK